MPRIGETDTDSLTEIPGQLSRDTMEEEEDEFGYTWSKLCFSSSAMTRRSPPDGSVVILESHKDHSGVLRHKVNKVLFFFNVLNLL